MAQAFKYQQLPEKYTVNLLQKVDKRSEVYRKLRRSYDAICNELGGESKLSHVKLTIVERFVFLEALLETWEHVIATDPKSCQTLLSRWIQGLNSLVGMSRILGLERQMKKPGDLKAYVEGKTF